MTQIDSYPVTSPETPSQPLEFETIYKQYAEAIKSRAYKLGSPDPEAATQVTFMRVFNNLDTYEDQGKDIGAWLNTIVRNIVFDQKKALGRHPEYPSSDWLPYETTPADARFDTESIVDSREMGSLAAAAIGHVVGDDRLTMLQMYADGFSYEEIAESTGKKVGTVKSGINRARKAARSSPQIRKYASRVIKIEPEEAAD